ncbi:MAG: hypothetical protein U0K14_02145 [Eggerthellaceae bacterium]|nr:hypothetical protein [Eggerthellaceae bacterium]
MELWRVALDWMLIITSTYVLFRTYNRIMMERDVSLGNYVFLVFWIFYCLPIALDYVIGMPQYETVYWYQPFIVCMSNDYVSALYDMVILVAVLVIYFYCNRYQKKPMRSKQWGGPLFESKGTLLFFVFLPIFYIVLSGNVSSYLYYGDSVSRGLAEDGTSMIVAGLLLLSLLSFCNIFFNRESISGFLNLIVLISYSGLVAWISGKRFMLAIMLVMYLYYYLKRNPSEPSRRFLKISLPLIIIGLLGFSAFYLIGVRPLRDTGFMSVYDMLRVDFGRDDVTKYVIYHEFMLDDPILEFRGQTFLSTLLIWVPRAIWPGKPFQHYQYLTSSILGLPISELPAGTTPGWFEMCICNFSYVGIIVSLVLLYIFIRISDSAKYVATESIALILILALLTQSIDVYLVFVAAIALQLFVKGLQMLRGHRRKAAKRIA